MRDGILVFSASLKLDRAGIALLGAIAMIASGAVPLTEAGILLCSRKMHSRQIMELVDWHLLTLFCALFIVVHGITTRNIPSQIMAAMAQQGITITNLFALTGISTLMSNLVSNVPAAMFLVRFLDPGVPEQWYVLALSSTFAGNLIIIGNIANLIVIEQAKKFLITIELQPAFKDGSVTC